MKWNIKEENLPTETVFFIRKGKNVVGIITGKEHIEGDIEKARLRANQIIEESEKKSREGS
jgi:hypothetical protein